MMLQTSDGNVKSMVFNNTCNGTSLPGTNTLIGGSHYQFPAFGQKYRVVSCLMKVTYNGSVLNQSGKLFACHTFENTVTLGGPTATGTDSALDRYSVDFSLVRNGLWSDVVNVTAHAEGIELLYAPLDPTAQAYVSVGKPQFDSVPSYPSTTVTTNFTMDDGAQSQFIVAGQNFPASTNCINIEIYTTYEVIPDPTAGFMASQEAFSLNTSDYEYLAKTVSQSPKVRPVKENFSINKLLNKGKDLLEKVAKHPLTGLVIDSIKSALI